jgi:hypothetical protein
MPRKPRQPRRNLAEQEGRIQLAIHALKKREILSICQATEVFEIPYSTLRDRMNGHQYNAEQRNHTFRLSKTQEKALVEWIVSRD